MSDLIVYQGGALAPPTGALVAGQVADSSKAKYTLEIKYWCAWLGRDPALATHIDLVTYRDWLLRRYKQSTAQRKLSMIKSVYHEAFLAGHIAQDIGAGVKGVKSAGESDRHQALTLEQSRALVRAARNPKRLTHARDHAIIMLLWRTGIRRAELCALTSADIAIMQEHHVLWVTRKGGKRQAVKVPVDVWRDAMLPYLARRSQELGDDNGALPLFYGVKGNQLTRARLNRLSLSRVNVLIRDLGRKIGIANLTVHSLRATFVTQSLAGGAPLYKVQYAAGHADPRTTERYHKRKLDLDINAVDYITG